MEQEKQSAGSKELTEEIKDAIVKEVKKSFEEIHHEISRLTQVFELYQKTTEVRNNLQEEEIAAINKAWKEHIIVCEKQKSDIADLIDAVTTIRAGMKFTNFVRNAIVWVAGGATAVYSLYQMVKDYFK